MLVLHVKITITSACTATASINRQTNNSWQRKQNMAKHANAAVCS